MTRPRYAIIPTNDRPCLKDCLDAIAPQVDRVIVIHTGDAEVEWTLGYGGLHTATVDVGDVNISKWWNIGLELAEEEREETDHSAPEWDVAILNDDAIVPEGWFDAVSANMRAYEAAAACSGAPYTQLLIEPGPIAGISNPLTGFAFMLAGEKGLRANEDLHWYFSDNYIDWESRKLGGTLMMSGWPVQHLHANAQMGHDLIARVAVDAQNFVDLYGVRPW